MNRIYQVIISNLLILNNLKWICLSIRSIFQVKTTQSVLQSLQQSKVDFTISNNGHISVNNILKFIRFVDFILSLHFEFSVIDSWGTIPSGVLSGNHYDFGEFSQCFNIKRNGKIMKTQYCMGKLVFDLDKYLKSKSILPL